MGIKGLVDALKDPKTQAITKDLQNYGWVRCSTSNPENPEFLMVTNGKEQWIGYYNRKAKKWVVAEDSPFKAESIVAWTYKPELHELQECLNLKV